MIMEQHTDNSGLYLNDFIPYRQHAYVLAQMWDKAEQEIYAIQHPHVESDDMDCLILNNPQLQLPLSLSCPLNSIVVGGDYFGGH
jgi:hypothetical protein